MMMPEAWPPTLRVQKELQSNIKQLDACREDRVYKVLGGVLMSWCSGELG